MAASPVAMGPPAVAERHARGETGRLVCAGAAVVLAVAGVGSILSTGYYLWDLWTTDPLKSVGALVPMVSLVLILRVWRSLGWEVDGTWWGLLLLAATVAAVHWRDHAVLALVVSPAWTIFLPPHSLVALAYVAGVVLVVGGGRLLRAAWFPVLLILLVNPVPHAFNRLVDLPLQQLAAATARGWAHLLGQGLTPDQLRLMFTPQFGMFIAPGCDGIRGSVTMGLMALVASYLYRMRVGRAAAFVAAAVLLGYVFNLLRLCVLVLYYVVALRVPWLQSRAEMGDYVIGAALFFGATVLLFSVLRRASPAGDLRPPALPVRRAAPAGGGERAFWWRWASVAALMTLGAVPYARALAAGVAQLPEGTVFPAQMGPYVLEQTWQERLPGGAVLFDWATYRRAGVDGAVSIGVAPVLGAHDTLICHAARGERWAWRGSLRETTAEGAMAFAGTLWNDGAAQTLEASTLCAGGSCGEAASGGGQPGAGWGLVYSRPALRTVLGGEPAKPVPVLLKTELPEAEMPAEQARVELEGRLRAFLAYAPVVSLARRSRLP